MSHLGDRLAALIDGELDHDARDRVLAHLTGCGECRREADAYRRLKAELGHLTGPPPSSELMHRLLSMAGPAGPMPRPAPTAPARNLLRPGRAGPGSFGASAAALAAGAHRGRGGRLRYALVGAVSLGTLALGASFAAGGSAGNGGARPVTPPVEVYAFEHAVTVGEVPVVYPGAGTGAVTTVVSTARP